MTLLDDVRRCNTIAELSDLVRDARPQVSLFQGRRFTVRGHEGSVRFNDILKKAETLFKALKKENSQEACQLLKEILIREKTSSGENLFVLFFHKTFNIIYSIKQFFGNIGRDTRISNLTEAVLNKNPELLKEFSFDQQIGYCKKHPDFLKHAGAKVQNAIVFEDLKQLKHAGLNLTQAFEGVKNKPETLQNQSFDFQFHYCKQYPETLKHAKSWVQKVVILENPKLLFKASKETQEAFHTKRFGLNFIFSGITSKDLELEHGLKSITITKDRTMTLNEIADHLMNQIRFIEDEKGNIKKKFESSGEVPEEISCVLYGDHIAIAYNHDPILRAANSQDHNDKYQGINDVDRCLDEILNALIENKMLEPHTFKNERSGFRLAKIPKRNLKALENKSLHEN